MLVLTRKSKESVVIGGSDTFERVLKVTVVEIQGERVRLGFEADADVPVHRLEVWERIRAGELPKGPPAGAAAPAKGQKISRSQAAPGYENNRSDAGPSFGE
jgi:carbon storage regulator